MVRFDEIMEKQQGKDDSVEGTSIQVMKPDEASKKPWESREAGQRLIPGPQENNSVSAEWDWRWNSPTFPDALTD